MLTFACVIEKQKLKSNVVSVAQIRDKIDGFEVFKLFQPANKFDFLGKRPYIAEQCENCKLVSKEFTHECIQKRTVINILALAATASEIADEQKKVRIPNRKKFNNSISNLSRLKNGMTDESETEDNSNSSESSSGDSDSDESITTEFLNNKRNQIADLEDEESEKEQQKKKRIIKKRNQVSDSNSGSDSESFAYSIASLKKKKTKRIIASEDDESEEEVKKKKRKVSKKKIRKNEKSNSKRKCLNKKKVKEINSLPKKKKQFKQELNKTLDKKNLREIEDFILNRNNEESEDREDVLELDTYDLDFDKDGTSESPSFRNEFNTEVGKKVSDVKNNTDGESNKDKEEPVKKKISSETFMSSKTTNSENQNMSNNLVDINNINDDSGFQEDFDPVTLDSSENCIEIDAPGIKKTPVNVTTRGVSEVTSNAPDKGDSSTTTQLTSSVPAVASNASKNRDSSTPRQVTSSEPVIANASENTDSSTPTQVTSSVPVLASNASQNGGSSIPVQVISNVSVVVANASNNESEEDVIRPFDIPKTSMHIPTLLRNLNVLDVVPGHRDWIYFGLNVAIEDNVWTSMRLPVYDRNRFVRTVAKIYWSRSELSKRCFKINKVNKPNDRIIFEVEKINALKAVVSQYMTLRGKKRKAEIREFLEGTANGQTTITDVLRRMVQDIRSGKCESFKMNFDDCIHYVNEGDE